MMNEKLRSTRNYSLFVSDSTNRDVTNIRKLTQSMKKYGYIPAYPIHTFKEPDGTFSVLDGGHRLAAATLLKLPVYYVELQNKDISIPEINATQRKWNLMDYAKSFCRAGNRHYQMLLDIHEKYGIPLSVCKLLLSCTPQSERNAGSGGFGTNDSFKNGKFEVTTLDHAIKVLRILTSIKTHNPIYRNTLFISALSKACFLAQFDGDRFAQNAARMSRQLVQCATHHDYLQLIEMIYNDHYTYSKRIPVKFLAIQASA